MSNIFVHKQDNIASWMRTSLSAFLLMAILETSVGLEVPHAQAQLATAPTDAPTNWYTTIQQTLGTVANVASKAYDAANKNKEFVLDPIAWFAAKFAIQQIQKATLNWINSGFDGSPAFVQDLGGFLESNADKLAGEFIYGSDLKALCSPFALNIKIALSIKYLRKDPPARCTLSGVVGNVENFLGGDFASGGLPGWFELTVNPNNNFFGAYAAADSALFAKQLKTKEVDINKLIFGKGFLGKEVCDEVAASVDQAINNYGSSTMAQKKNCKTVTPGDTIATSLNEMLHVGKDELVAADEFNEIISALFQQLAVKALTGANGLLGVSEPDSTQGNTSYLDRIGDTRYDTMPGQSTLGNDLILKAISEESAFRTLYAGVVAKADDILARISSVIAEFTAKSNAILSRISQLDTLVANESDDEIWTCSNMDDIRARAHAIPGETVSLTDPVRLKTTDVRTPAFAILTESDRNLVTLNDLQTRYAATIASGGTAAEARLRVVEEFMNLQSKGTLHEDTDTERAKVLIEGLSFSGTSIGQNIDGIPETTNHKLAALKNEYNTLEQNELAALRSELAALASTVESRCHMTKKPKS